MDVFADSKMFEVAWDQWEHWNRALHNANNKFDQVTKQQLDNNIWYEFLIGFEQLLTANKGIF